MADPILHVSDCYYFEVPKLLYAYDSLDQIPSWIRNHPQTHGHTLADFKRELDGKIIIPQPFGTPKTLYEPGAGFAISKFMVLEVIAVTLIAAAFIWLANKVKDGDAPRGRMWNLLETFVVFVRDNIAKPTIGEHDAEKFLPFLWTIFFFILTCNLLGLVPWLGAATGGFGATLALAGIVIATSIGCGIRKFGAVGFWLNQCPHMDLPPVLYPIKVLILLLEIMGMFIKHAVLAIRLLANMVAGHLVLLAVMGLVVQLEDPGFFQWSLVAFISVGGATCLMFLELMVAFLQAYVFTFLSSMFIGMAVHHH